MSVLKSLKTRLGLDTPQKPCPILTLAKLCAQHDLYVKYVFSGLGGPIFCQVSTGADFKHSVASTSIEDSFKSEELGRKKIAEITLISVEILLAC